jgi:tetratricopeptide (TPR) repeat protein
MRSQRSKPKPPRKPVLPWVLVAAVLIVTSVGLLKWNATRVTVSKLQTQAAPQAKQSDESVFATYGKSPSCKSCHEDEFKVWQNSHHALAERKVDRALDSAAFEPPHKIRHAFQNSEARTSDGKFQLLTVGIEGEQKAFVPERVIGVAPLLQFLIPAPGGRLQSTELAFDPKASNWFDVYGEEDRHPGEWGHWTGRGMTWNMMCAACHNTRLRKNYQENTDSYSTTMAEMGVGCEACHGPMADHNAWQAKHPQQPNDPSLRRITREEMFSVCGSCHSRRAELTGDFRPGENFFDHYALTIPDETDTFYPDGQIRDEDYEFTSFLGSRMHAAGVRCIDCHEPHSGKTRVPGNNLCLVCHAAPTPPAPKIEPTTHSHHKLGERGDNCVDCHMPQTTYMQRHARRDHGFTIPDPLLTKQVGIPNACARCHADKGLDWQIDAVQKWYGPRMERPSRARAQVIAHARSGERGVADDLAKLLRSETNSFWRAVSAGLLKRSSADPRVTGALLSSAGDTSPLVRSMSIRALEPLAQTASQPIRTALASRLTDPVRAVRIDAAWALRTSLDTNSIAGSDLLAYLHHSADQPSGALQMGVFHLDRSDLPGAITWFQRAVSWDTNSVPPHHALAVAFSMTGKKEQAVEELQAACRAAPRDAESQFKLGLALNETGQLEKSRAALAEAVKLDPQFSQAWYNLGLACNALGQTESALQNLVRAESLDTSSPQIPYARATILARVGRVDEARTAAHRALEIDPTYSEAAGFLKWLSQ